MKRRILLVNWNDRTNPHAGGAEIHLHELFGRRHSAEARRERDHVELVGARRRDDACDQSRVRLRVGVDAENPFTRRDRSAALERPDLADPALWQRSIVDDAKP